jgi:periplasmic protein TonB
MARGLHAGNAMPQSKTALLLSVAIHVTVVILMFTVVYVAEFHPLIRPLSNVVTAPPPVKLRLLLAGAGAGGGGMRVPVPPTKGDLPKPVPRPFVPPAPNPPEAKLYLDASIDIPLEQAPKPQFGTVGDPLAAAFTGSPGPGGPGGIGAGDGPSIGNRRGPGYGSEPGSGISARSLLGVTAPVVVYRVDPEYSEEARKAKHQGTVVVTVEIDQTGKPSNLRVLRALGLGLDQRALEAVAKWRFRPARKDGRAVPFPATIEVNFRLL